MVYEAASTLLSLPVDRYITVHRNRLAGSARELSQVERSGLWGYFESSELDRVRVMVADPLPIGEPPLAGVVRSLGFDFPNIASTAAITFDWLILARAQLDSSLLFHEMVHVVQYRRLGVAAFARKYVEGFLRHRSYEDIPLERCAFELEYRYSMQTRTFAVEDEVIRWLET
jgi:hypothetical protein